MSKEEAQIIRENRNRLRNDLKMILKKNKVQEEESEKKLAEKFKTQQKLQKGSKKGNFERKKSLNITYLPNHFDMFDCGQIEVNTGFDQLYEIKEKIDEGTQAVVYKCVERETQQIQVVKIIRNKDLDLIKTLKKQFLISKNISHEGLLKTHHLFVDEKKGVSHLVMEYCPYSNLRFYIAKNSKIPEGQAAKITQSLLKILMFLHQKGICHRDVKPQNILYNPVDGDMKLIDFGISRMTKYQHEVLQMWTNTGTTFYKAPEIFAGGYDFSVDIWATGVICYEMIIGKVPFYNKFQKQTIRQIKQDEPEFSMTKFTERSIKFLKKTLNKDKKLRFTAIQALKTPFIWTCKSGSTVQSPLMKRKKSEKKIKVFSGFNPSPTSFDDNSQLKNSDCLSPNSGIRLIVEFSEQFDKDFI